MDSFNCGIIASASPSSTVTGRSATVTRLAASGAGGPFNDYDYPAMIGEAFAANPKFRLMVGTGIYDLTTTVGPARYLAAQGYFPKDQVSQKTYEGGHMAYTNEPALKAFTSDVRAFVTPR